MRVPAFYDALVTASSVSPKLPSNGGTSRACRAADARRAAYPSAMATGAAGVLLLLVVWAVPVVAVIYLFRTLGVLIDGMRSINAHLARISEQLERTDRL